MSCRHSLANTTCRRCYPTTGTLDPGPEQDHGPNLEGPGAVAIGSKSVGRRPDQDEELTTRNAVVESAEIFRDNRDCKVIVRLSYGSAGSQAVGTRVLSASLVHRLMQVAGAVSWSELPGKFLRAKVSEKSGVVELGHLIEEDWLDPAHPDEIRDDIPC